MNITQLIQLVASALACIQLILFMLVGLYCMFCPKPSTEEQERMRWRGEW